MGWKGAVSDQQRRHNLIRGIQVLISALALTALICVTRNRWPELALTFYFLYVGPIVVASYTWGREVGGLIILAAVSFFVPIMLGTVANLAGGSIDLSWQAMPGEFAEVLAVRVLELAASVALFGTLAIVGDRAGGHRIQRDRYRQLDRIGERLSRELQVEELLQVILDQTMPLFGAAGGEIVLRNEQTHQLEIAAAAGVSQEAQRYLQRRAYLEQSASMTARGARTHETLAELTLRRNEPFLHNQLQNDPRYVYCDGDTPLLRTQAHSVLTVPLRRGREPFGLLSLFNKSNGGFDQGDIDLLTAVAEKSAIAIENARLYHQTDASLARRVEELSILNRIAHTLVSSLDLDQTIQTILEALHALFPYAIAEVCLWEPVNQVMRTYAWSGNREYAEKTGGFYRLNEGYSGWIARHWEQLWISDLQARQDVRPKVDSADFPFRSYVGFPLLVGRQLIGTLEMVSYEPDAFAISAKSMLEALCNQAAVAIHNARLYQERQHRLAEMAGLQQISQAIGAVRDVDQVYNLLTERIAQLMHVEYCGVLLYDPQAEALVSRPPFYGVPSEMIELYRIPMPQDGLLWSIWKEEEHWYINDVQSNPLTAHVGLTDLAAAAGVRATMFAPLAAGGRRFGILQVSNKRDGSPFDDNDARLLSIFAHQAAVVLENARLYEVEQDRRRAMEALQAAATAMSAALDLGAVVQIVADWAVTVFQADTLSVMLPDPLEQNLLVEAAHGLSDDFVAAYRLSRDWVVDSLEQHGTQPRLLEAPDLRAIVPDALFASENLSWAAFAPLVSSGEPLGALQIYGRGNGPPMGEDEMELVALFANQAAVSIQNARLYTQTDARLHQRLRELTVLNRIGQELNATLDLERILNLMLKEAVQATQASHGNVNLMNWDLGILEARATFGLDPEQLPRLKIDLALGQGIISRAAQTAQPVIVDDVTFDPDYVAIVPETRSELAMPIIHRGVVLGVINLESPQVGSFTEAHIAFLETLAAQAAVAISNARTYEEQAERSELHRRRAEQLSHLFEIGQTLRTDRPLEEVLTEVAFAVQETVGFDVALISVCEEDQQRRVAAAGIPVAEFERMRQVRQPWANLDSLFQEEFRISNSFYIPYERAEVTRHLDTFQIEASAFEREPGQWHPEDMLIVPLQGSGNVILGILSVDQPRNGRVPDRMTVEALEIFAAQAALAVENARLVDDLKRWLDELTLFNEVGRSISARLDLEGLLDTVVEAAAELLDAPRSILFLHDSSDGLTELVNVGPAAVRRTPLTPAGHPPLLGDLHAEQVSAAGKVLSSSKGEVLSLPKEGTAEDEAFVPWCARGYDLAELKPLRFCAGEGLVGTVVKTARAIVIPDTWQDERFQLLIPAPSLAKDGPESDQPVRSTILVPLIFGGKVIGVLSVDHSRPFAFSNADITSLSMLADQAAIAVENARLYEETLNRTRQLSRLNEAARAISSELELPRVLQVVSQQMVELLNVAGCLISDWDREQNAVRAIVEYPHQWGTNSDLPKFYPLDQYPLTRHVLEERATIQVHAADPQAGPDEWAWMEAAGVASLLMLPLVSGDRAVGLLELVQETHHPFNEAETQLAQTLANQAAVAIENARLFEEVRSYQDELEQRVEERTAALERERDRVETLYRITSELGTSLDLDRVLNRALSLVLDAVESEQGSVFMLDQSRGRIVHRAVLWEEGWNGDPDVRKTLPVGGVLTRFQRGEGLAGWVMETKQPAIVDNIYEDPRWVEIEERERWHRSILAVPLIVSDEAVGALLLYHSQVGFFTYEHLRLVEAAATQVASAINNAELYRYVYESADRLGRMMKAQQVETTKTEAILEGVADGVMVADAGGVVIRFNAAAERILNTPREQILNRSIDDLLGLYGASGAAWARSIANWMVSPPRRWEEALLAEQLGIEDRIVSVLLSPVVMGDEFLGTVSLFRDITQQVELERTKSEFVSTVSHELRTPMTSIKGYADLLLLGASGELNENQTRFLSIIKTNADRLTMLVNDLLDIGRIDTDRIELNLKEIKLTHVVGAVMDSLKARSQSKGQTLSAEVPTDLPPVLADRDRLIQILTNLIGNAQQYTPSGGHITISVSLVESEETEQRMLQVNVADDGIGIAPEDHEKVFERFFRADHPMVQDTPGTGLGLSITNSLVAMHGGKLWVESGVGQGSTFSFTLPVATETRLAPARQAVAES
jgi:GAF domain-containing protein/nitrogen-specific signal transduction histidine kinase